MRRRTRRIGLDLATGAFLLASLAYAGVTRLAPAWDARGVAEVGERLPRALRLRSLAGHDTLGLPAGAPALLLVYRSSCPACHRGLAAWRDLLRRMPPRVRVLGVALEPDAPGRAFVRRHLPRALAVAPVDPERFAAVLALRVVPTTLYVDGAGRLRFREPGPLTAPARDALLALTGRRAAGGTAARRRPSSDSKRLLAIP